MYLFTQPGLDIAEDKKDGAPSENRLISNDLLAKATKHLNKQGDQIYALVGWLLD